MAQSREISMRNCQFDSVRYPEHYQSRDKLSNQLIQYITNRETKLSVRYYNRIQHHFPVTVPVEKASMLMKL